MDLPAQLSLAAAAGLLLGAVVTWLVGRVNRARLQEKLSAGETRLADMETRLETAKNEETSLRDQLTEARTQLATWKTRAEEEERATAEKLEMLRVAEARLGDAFKALSSEALRSNQEQFLLLARSSWEKQTEEAKAEMKARQTGVETLLKPIGEALQKFERRVGEIEVAREGAYAGLKEHLRGVHEAQGMLRDETARLVRALRQPSGRGQWGEMQLRRVAELAGMREHCDFDLQTSTTGDDGDRLRPDMLVHLPGKRHVVVDAKTPMDAYLEALDAADDASRQSALQRHAKQVRQQITQLGAKDYAARYGPGPEFVVLFLPSEAIFAAALDQDPTLIEKAVGQGVMLATPTTLIALLRVIAQGWREETLAANAREISALGRRLHERLGLMNSHLAKLGRALSTSVDAYNKTVGSFESRVLADARRFEDLGATATGAELPPPQPVENVPRPLSSADLSPGVAESVGFPLPPATESGDESGDDDDDFLKLPGQA
jgi:DNA recombination protein RmuC